MLQQLAIQQPPPPPPPPASQRSSSLDLDSQVRAVSGCTSLNEMPSTNSFAWQGTQVAGQQLPSFPALGTPLCLWRLSLGIACQSPKADSHCMLLLQALQDSSLHGHKAARAAIGGMGADSHPGQDPGVADGWKQQYSSDLLHAARYAAMTQNVASAGELDAHRVPCCDFILDMLSALGVLQGTAAYERAS